MRSKTFVTRTKYKYTVLLGDDNGMPNPRARSKNSKDYQGLSRDAYRQYGVRKVRRNA